MTTLAQLVEEADRGDLGIGMDVEELINLPFEIADIVGPMTILSVYETGGRLYIEVESKK